MLTLRRSTASERTLERILRCTPQLTGLVYDRWVATDLGPPHWGDYAPDCRNVSRRPCSLCTDKLSTKRREFSCKLLDYALIHVRETLQSFVIKLRFRRQQHTNLKMLHCAVIGRTRIVKNMTMLTHLEIPWVVLLGWEASAPPLLDLHTGQDPLTHRWTMTLPKSIRSLLLRNDTSNLAHYTYATPAARILIESLIAAREGQFPSLTKLDLFYTFDRRQDELVTIAIRQDLKPFLAFLQSLCSRAGILCQFTYEKRNENQVLYEVVE